MTSANSNAIEPIPEETHAESQSAESEAAPPAIGMQQTDAESDKCENVTDPVVLRKARAAAKTQHMRTINNIGSKLPECGIGDLKLWCEFLPEFRTR